MRATDNRLIGVSAVCRTFTAAIIREPVVLMFFQAAAWRRPFQDHLYQASSVLLVVDQVGGQVNHIPNNGAYRRAKDYFCQLL